MKLISFSVKLLFVFCLFIPKTTTAQLSVNDVTVTVNYVNGSLRVQWPDGTSASGVCGNYALDEKISYQIGGSAAVRIFENAVGFKYGLATGVSTSANFADFTNLPAAFFENQVSVKMEGRYGNANATCASPLIPVNITKQVATSLENPQSLSATRDASCASVDLSWSAPSIVSGASALRFEIARRTANTSNPFINVNTNVSGTATSFIDAGAPAGIEQEYKIKTKMLYSGTRTATTSGANVNGRKVGISGNPSGVFIDQANCIGALDVNWNWSNSNNPDNFIIYRATDIGFTAGVTTTTLSGSDRSYRDNSAASGISYYYRVRASTSCPNSTTPLFSSYTTPPEQQVGLGVPSAATTTSISVDTIARRVTLNWTDNSLNEDGFKIVRQGPTGQVVFDVSENVVTYVDNTADICENLTYSVKAYNTCRANGVASTNSKSAYIPADIGSVFNTTNFKVVASDGEFGDRIELKWATNTRQVDDWYIYRINPLIPDTTFIASVEGKSRFYADNNANANTLYNYLIQGVTDCASNTLLSNTTKDVGFRLAFGTANGQVTYDGGTAVEGVKITAEAASGASGNSGNFNGTSAYANAGNRSDLQTDSMTIMSFIRPTNLTGKKVIASKITSATGWEFYLDGANLKLTTGSKTITATSPDIIANNWVSVGATVSGDSVKLYVNGLPINSEASTQLSTNTASNFFIGKDTTSGYFLGQIDEMRFYNRALTDQEIERSFDVYINPSQNGLVGYWRFDEGFGSNAYDYSKTLLTPNKNNAALVNVTFNASKPSTTQLVAGAYTDKRGSYFIPFIPFLGNGDNFIITPAFGTHTFTPATTTLFVGGSTPNFNNVNFIDNSSFNVTGSVKYVGSTCHVEDVFIKVDGNVVIQYGLPVTTGDSGSFSLQVPIGPHVITADKVSHQFTVGRFPTTGNFNFQQNEVLGAFEDNTLMKVVGRVAGGGIQKDLPPGMDRGTNNIGKSTLVFEATQNTCITKSVQTNNTTGEYEILLPPMNYSMPNFRVSSNQAIEFKNITQLDLSFAPPPQTETDTLYRDSVGVRKVVRIDSSVFNKELDFILFEAPTLNVLDENFSNTYGSDSVRINVNDSSWNIPTNVLGLTYPIFEENTSYKWNIQANEIYVNKDDLNNIIYDSVPITDGKFVINNALATTPAEEFTIKPLDKFNGNQPYRFTAGQANTAQNALLPQYSFTQQFELTLITPNHTEPYRPHKSDPNSMLFRGVIFGGRALGNSFATAGPQVVTMILRDPPGSESFATWAKETAHTTVSTYENGGGLGLALQKNFKLGAKFSIGLGYTTETEIRSDLLSTTTLETSITSTNEVVETTTNSVELTTSADPEFVGPDADLYFGKSMNMDFGLSQVITLIETSKCGDGVNECYGSTFNYGMKSFRIGSTKNMFTIPGGYGTEFVFTEKGIEESVIPRLEDLRNQQLNSSQYARRIFPGQQNYGTSNDDPIHGGLATPKPEENAIEDAIGESYTFSGYSTKDTLVTNLAGIGKTIRITTGLDSVWWYNRQIKLWQDAIARNEKSKVEANSTNLDRNISYQAGGGITYTSSNTREETDNTTVTFNLSEDLTLVIAAEIGGNGVEVNQNLNLNYSHTTSNSTTNSTTTTFSYTIEDPDAGDDFSVDVFNAKDGYGAIFKTRGGQTACPFQNETKTKYFRPGTVIDKATIQLEQPRITASPTTVYNVPADAAGIITLNLINDGLEDQVYDLSILESSNPFGAILTIDGINPNRSFAVPAQTGITKLLSVKKGPIFIHYDSIALVFHSQCQYAFGTANYTDIADTVYVSVNFLPSCTDIEISSPEDQFVLNNSFNDTLPILIDGYDINYGGLEKIGLQYKPSAQSSWIPLQEEWFFDTLATDTNVSKTKTLFRVKYPNHPAPYLIPTNQNYITYQLKTNQLIDQPYQLRAVATCKVPGNPDKDEFSTIIGGIADRVNPEPFGTPSPADGVLDPNDDISIQFNETIESGSLTRDNFQVSGVVNGQEVRHDKVVNFDGANGYLEVANGFDFASGSFTVEFWAKRNQLGTDQVVISQGNNSNNLFAVGFSANDNVTVTVGNQTYASTFRILDDSTWHHYSVIYDKPGLNLDIVDRSSSATVASTNNNFFSSFTSGGKTFFGKNSLTNGQHFNGSAHQIRIWNRALTSSIVASRLNVNLTGREPGLVGYWPMEEGRGTLAEDVARSRNAEVHAQWEISPKSNSVTFDGTNDYLLLDSAGTLAASFEMDLSIEFWFKTAGDSAMTFLSNGGGRFLPNDVNRNGWNIEMAADKTIHVKNDSTDFVAVTADFADNNWHHFAFVLNRSANATAYIDGLQQQTLPATNFYGFGAPKLAIGARYAINGTVETIDQYFNGSIDEVRIWNSARLKDNLDLDMFNRLSGNEFGLMAYYPFEGYVVQLGVPSLTPSFNDASLSLLHLKSMNGATANALQTPAIALPRPVKNINFTWSVNNDKIVINTNEAPANIENVTLNISVKDVRDLHGNEMQSPKTWIAFINKNQVKWQDIEKTLVKEFNDTLTFSTRVVNSGGQVKSYSITNIPAWLTVSPSNGTISPQSIQAVRFTVNPALNIGDYTEDLLLSTDFGYAEKLTVNLEVRKTAPDFPFDRSLYAKSMNVICQIAINGNISVNDEDLLVAYINNEIRGKTNLRYVPSLDKYIGFLDVYSNTADSVKFKVWNASEGELHENVTPNLFFVENSLTGSILNPQIFNAINNLSKPIVLNAGWNWVSFPLTDRKMSSLYSFFQGMNFSSGDVVKTIGTNSIAQYGGPTLGWSGSLTRNGLNNNQSYLIYISTTDTLAYKGLAIDPDTVPITVAQGWNRIGFVSTKNIEINSALANYNATDGDLIKSQQAFAVYLSTLGWVGSLTTLEPTEGYLLKAANSSTFVYPRRGLLRIKEEPVQEKLNGTLPTLYSLNPNQFEASTNAIVKINTCEELLENKDWALAAFKNEELRGWVGSTKYINEELGNQYFITVFGEGNETYTFKMINQATGDQMMVDAKLDFEKNNVQGAVSSPLRFNLFTEVDCDQFKTALTAEEQSENYSYPNPFAGFVTIVVPNEISENGQLEIVDKNGRVVFSENVDANKKWHLNGAELYFLANGVYTVKFTDGETIITEKLVRIK
ncbi:MAG: hypothetical protein ACJAV5_000193 [Vicingaceae bacterium]|jgi:hypothetical protein